MSKKENTPQQVDPNLVNVRQDANGRYHFATSRHGKFDIGTKEELVKFMRRNGYTYKIKLYER